MDSAHVRQMLFAAAGEHKQALAESNLFKQIAFDGDAPRLGWVVPPRTEDVMGYVERLAQLIGPADTVIFNGMGGSINGVKALLSLGKATRVHTIDTLDPEGLLPFAGKGYETNVKVFSLSKSGSTAETQKAARALKALFGKKDNDCFVWLSDPPAIERLRDDWHGAHFLPLQIDGKTDIGGRFSCPHTGVFLAALYALMRDPSRIRVLWDAYLSLHEKTLTGALACAERYAGRQAAFFSFGMDGAYAAILNEWTVQLFQESLGSKQPGFFVKTLVHARGAAVPAPFETVEITVPDVADDIVRLMCAMYFCQIFLAAFSLSRRINFVTQDGVEAYKRKVKELQSCAFTAPAVLSEAQLIEAVRSALTPGRPFIEVVLFYQAPREEIMRLRAALERAFPAHRVFVFIGSDWNHHSYQAAFLDERTLYVIAVRKTYRDTVGPVDPQLLRENVRTLQLIALASFKTIEQKSLFVTL